MANTPHSTMSDPDLHEPKGVSSAVAGSIYQADGAGSGNWKLPIQKLTVALSPSTVANNTTEEQIFAVGGVVGSTDSVISVNKPTAQAGLGIVGWRVVADGQVGITFANPTNGGITPTAGEVYTILI